ncbi:MAG: helix-turn-helix domain-containing protein, partial [Thermocrispum sp.]
MRVTTAFKRLLRLPGVNVTGVEFGERRVLVTVGLRRRRLVCPLCSFSTSARYDSRPVDSWWRHLDLGTWRLVVRARLRRLVCPDHGVRTEGVPFGRAGARFTRDFEDLVAWLAVKTDRSAIGELCRVAWRTVGAICERVCADELDGGRLEELFDIGVDEISWRKHHHYLTLVANHATGKIVW